MAKHIALESWICVIHFWDTIVINCPCMLSDTLTCRCPMMAQSLIPSTQLRSQRVSVSLHMFRLNCFGFSSLPECFEPHFPSRPYESSHAGFYLRAWNAWLANLERATFRTDMMNRNVTWCNRHDKASAYSGLSRCWKRTGELMELSAALAVPYDSPSQQDITLVSFGMSVQHPSHLAGQSKQRPVGHRTIFWPFLGLDLKVVTRVPQLFPTDAVEYLHWGYVRFVFITSLANAFYVRTLRTDLL